MLKGCEIHSNERIAPTQRLGLSGKMDGIAPTSYPIWATHGIPNGKKGHNREGLGNLPAGKGF